MLLYCQDSNPKLLSATYADKRMFVIHVWVKDLLNLTIPVVAISVGPSHVHMAEVILAEHLVRCAAKLTDIYWQMYSDV